MDTKSVSSRSEKPANESRTFSTVKSKTDWARLNSGANEAQPTPDHPESEVKHMVRSLVRKGLEPLPHKAQGTGHSTKSGYRDFPRSQVR